MMGQFEEGIAQLVARLSTLACRSPDWTISAEDIMSILSVEPVRFWRALHAARERIHLVDAIDGFCQDTVGDLITVLEGIVGPEAEEAFTSAGLFLPHVIRADLMEHLIRQAHELAVAHELQKVEFGAMLRLYRRIPVAIATYFQAFINLDATIDQCAESFRLGQGIAKLGAATAARYLRSLFSRHVLNRDTLLAELERRLRFAAREMGYIEAEEQETRGEGASGVSRSDEDERLRWARAVMGFPQEAISLDNLRRRYRALVMRYHPDVNPRGLERCKDINAAYAFLVSGGANSSAV